MSVPDFLLVNQNSPDPGLTVSPVCWKIPRESEDAPSGVATTGMALKLTKRLCLHLDQMATPRAWAMREHCLWSDCGHLPLYIGHTGSRKIQPVAVILSHATLLKGLAAGGHVHHSCLGPKPRQGNCLPTAILRIKTGLIISHPGNLAVQIIPARDPKVLVGTPADKTFRQEPLTRSSYQEPWRNLARSL